MTTACEPRIASGSAPSSIRARLDATLGDAQVLPGTSLAHALHDLFEAEVRQQGFQVAETAWAELDEANIRALGSDFIRLVAPSWTADVILPAGTVMISTTLGHVLIGSEALGLNIDAPGLHDIGDLPHRAGGSNLALLLCRIDELTVGQPFRVIGAPALVARFDGSHTVDFLQFPPFGPAGNVVLQRDMDFISDGEFFCGFSESLIGDLAAKIVEDMRRLLLTSRMLAPKIVAARRAARDFAATLRDVQVHAVTIGDQRGVSASATRVEFATWDHAFRRGIVRKLFGSLPAFRPKDELELRRADHVVALRALGADGRIGAVARAIANAAPQGVAAVLAALADDFETTVTLPTGTGPLRLRLHWHEGSIVPWVRSLECISVSESYISIRAAALPETIVVGLAGRRLDEVFDGPFRCTSRIQYAENKNGDLGIHLEPDQWLVNCREGRIWSKMRPDDE